MMGSGAMIYPMLGVGAFFGMFWIGFVTAYELGLGCTAMLLNGFFFGCAGSYLIVRLETRDVAVPRSRDAVHESSPRANPVRAVRRGDDAVSAVTSPRVPAVR